MAKFLLEIMDGNKEILEKAQIEIIIKGNNPEYLIEQHLKDIDLIAELEELKLKYK